MENASKALIIAGAILLAILIISLGIMVYNSAKETVSGGNLDATEISTFNSQWEAYVGTNVTASQVKALVAAAVASNAAEDKSGTGRHVYVASGEPDEIDVNDYTSNQTYTVSVKYADTGLVNDILVDSNGSGT